jgi:hypothetical protein
MKHHLVSRDDIIIVVETQLYFHVFRRFFCIFAPYHFPTVIFSAWRTMHDPIKWRFSHLRHDNDTPYDACLAGTLLFSGGPDRISGVRYDHK